MINETYMIDTNTVSHVVRGRSIAARAKFSSLKPNENVCISAITEAEICFGLANRADAHALRATMHSFLAKIRILPWGSQEAAAYGELRAKLKRSGKVLGNLDMLIAAHAVSVGVTLVTSDKAFRFVEELHGLTDWSTDL